MKKIIFAILLVPIFSIAQTDFDKVLKDKQNKNLEIQEFRLQIPEFRDSYNI